MFTLVPIDTPNIKACVTCSNLRGQRTYPERAEEWECFKAPIGIDLVTGKKHYQSCIYTREHPELCGKEGKWYEEYKAPSKVADAMDTDVPIPQQTPPEETPGAGKKVGKFSLDL